MRAFAAAIFTLAFLLAGCVSPAHPHVDPIAGAKVPGQILDLNGWTLTTPLFSNESGALEIRQPTLNSYRSNFLRATPDGGAVTFVTPVNGAVLDGAEFPRTELRQAKSDGSAATWSATRGMNVLAVRVSVDAVPSTGKQTQVVGQVHSVGPYILLIQLDGSLLYVKAGDKNIATLESNYRLGTPFTYQFFVTGGVITVYYNGKRAVTWNTDCQRCYFKTGSYLQIPPNMSREYGQTTIYALQVDSISTR